MKKKDKVKKIFPLLGKNLEKTETKLLDEIKQGLKDFREHRKKMRETRLYALQQAATENAEQEKEEDKQETPF